MTPHHIKKSFPGTQDGQHDRVEFQAGTVADLSRGLAAIAVKEGWAEPVALAATPAASGVSEADAPPEAEEKSLPGAPENKMKKPVKGKK